MKPCEIKLEITRNIGKMENNWKMKKSEEKNDTIVNSPSIQLILSNFEKKLDTIAYEHINQEFTLHMHLHLYLRCQLHVRQDIAEFSSIGG